MELSGGGRARAMLVAHGARTPAQPFDGREAVVDVSRLRLEGVSLQADGSYYLSFAPEKVWRAMRS